MSDSSAHRKLTTIEEGTELKGSLNSKCPVLVHGVVRGDVTVPSLTVTQSGQVIGQVTAGELRSSGVLEGTITADEMYVSGSVRDNSVITAKSLEVNPERSGDPAFVVFGTCVLNVGDEPALRGESAGDRRAAEPPVSRGETHEPAAAQSTGNAQGRESSEGQERVRPLTA